MFTLFSQMVFMEHNAIIKKKKKEEEEVRFHTVRDFDRI